MTVRSRGVNHGANDLLFSRARTLEGDNRRARAGCARCGARWLHETSMNDSPTPPMPREPKFDTFEVWKEYQKIAMHFNDLLMRLHSQSLAAVAAFAALAGVILRTDVDPTLRWDALVGVFGVLLLFWIAIWILDFAYYNRLLIGAPQRPCGASLESSRSTSVVNARLLSGVESPLPQHHYPDILQWFNGTLQAGRPCLSRSRLRIWAKFEQMCPACSGPPPSVVSARECRIRA